MAKFGNSMAGVIRKPHNNLLGQEEKNRMPGFSKSDRVTLRPYVIGYNNWLSRTIDGPVQKTLHLRPQELAELFEDLKRLMTWLGNADDKEMELDENLVAILKRSIIHTRRQKALSKEERSRITFNRGLRESLDDELTPVSTIMPRDWFRETEAARPVRLTDFLSLQWAEELLRKTGELTVLERVHDEKFQLLQAPTLFLPDLSHYRMICELRAVPVSVAYIDIDDFKIFNTRYGEPRVDRDVLPPFMSTLEAHLFSHGYAYRYGGDEYVAVLPNTSCSQATDLFLAFQKKLETLEYFEVVDRLHISVGICEVTEDCALTGYEVEERAAYAKNAAKRGGKNCIGIMTGPSYSDGDVQLVRQPEEP